MPVGPPGRPAVDTCNVAVSITDSVSTAWLVTTTRDPSGLSATPAGPTPTTTVCSTARRGPPGRSAHAAVAPPTATTATPPSNTARRDSRRRCGTSRASRAARASSPALPYRSSARLAIPWATTSSSARGSPARSVDGFGRRLGEVRGDGAEHVVGGERALPGEALGEHAGEGVDVDAVVVGVAGHALGGHVRGGAQREARPAGGAVAHLARDAEVGEVGEAPLGGALPDQQDVGRLDVAVHQAFRVRGVERVGHLGEHVDRPLRRQRAAPQQRGEVDALDQPHVQEQASADLAVVVDRDDVRLGQLRGERRLPPEPAAVLGIGRELLLEPLDGDGPVALHVERAEDLAHAAPADQRVEPVGAEALGHRGLAITGNADASRRTSLASARAMPTVSSSENSGIPTTTATCSHQCGRRRADAPALSARPVQ